MIRQGLFVIIAAATAAFAVDPVAVKMVPADAKIIGGMDLTRAKGSPFGKYILSQMKFEDKDLAEIMELTGFDPRRDLREVVFAGAPNNAFMVAKGTFDQARILNAARAKGAQTLVHMGFNVIAPDAKHASGEAMWALFLDNATVVGGTEAAVKAAVDRRNATADAKIAALINHLDSKHDAWVYTLQPGATLAGSMPNSSAQNNPFQGVVSATGGVKFGASVTIAGDAVARSDKDATALHDVLKFVAGMIQINSNDPKAQQVASLLESMKLSVSGTTVSMSLTIPEDQLEQLLQFSASGRRQRAAR